MITLHTMLVIMLSGRSQKWCYRDSMRHDTLIYGDQYRHAATVNLDGHCTVGISPFLSPSHPSEATLIYEYFVVVISSDTHR